MTQSLNIMAQHVALRRPELTDSCPVATVAQADPLLLSLEGRTAAASRAFSCLVTPLQGDSVQVAYVDGRPVVIAILARPGLGDAVLSVPDAAGAITLRAQALNLEASTAVSIRAPDITMTSAGMRFVADTIGWLGRSLTMVAERMRRSVDQDETVARQVSTRAVHRTTVVDAVDNEKIGTRVTSVDTVSTTTAEAAIIFTREDLRLDGKRITMG